MIQAQSHKIEQQNIAKGKNVTKYQQLSEGCYTNLQVQIQSDDGIIEQWYFLALMAWNMIEETEEKEST